MDESKQYNNIAEMYQNVSESGVKKYVVTPSFFDLCGDLKNKEVVDLACGSGYFTRLIKKRGAKNVSGIDISKEEIRIARKIEETQRLGITYFTKDVASLTISKYKKVDIATAAFLLHYSNTKEKLSKMCKCIFNLLKKGGRFITINGNPEIPTQNNLKYEFTASMDSPSKEGMIRKMTYYSKGKEIFSWNTYFWNKKTYEEALENAGFKNLKWKKIIISKEGIRKYGKEFWKEFLEQPYIIGLECTKP